MYYCSRILIKKQNDNINRACDVASTYEADVVYIAKELACDTKLMALVCLLSV